MTMPFQYGMEKSMENCEILALIIRLLTMAFFLFQLLLQRGFTP